MPPRSDRPTARVHPAPIVLAIACPHDLVIRLREAAIAAQSLVVEATVDNVATLAAQTRPLVMVLLEDVYSFDGKAFDALAADVRAKLVRLADDAVTQTELESALIAAVLEAEQGRESDV